MILMFCDSNTIYHPSFSVLYSQMSSKSPQQRIFRAYLDMKVMILDSVNYMTVNEKKCICANLKKNILFNLLFRNTELGNRGVIADICERKKTVHSLK